MRTLTLAEDIILNQSHEDKVIAGMTVQIDENHYRTYADFVPVIITEGYDRNGNPIGFVPFTDIFHRNSFLETRLDEYK